MAKGQDDPMNASNGGRIPREQETREAAARPELWRQPSALPEPNPRFGVTHRWVRTKCHGQDDPVNVATSFREGWTPVDAAEYPELMSTSDFGSRWPDGVEVGGLLLCKNAAAVMKQRADHYRQKTQDQMRAVDSQLDVPRDSQYGTSQRTHHSQVQFHPDAPIRRSGG